MVVFLSCDQIIKSCHHQVFVVYGYFNHPPDRHKPIAMLSYILLSNRSHVVNDAPILGVSPECGAWCQPNLRCSSGFLVHRVEM